MAASLYVRSMDTPKCDAGCGQESDASRPGRLTILVMALQRVAWFNSAKGSWHQATTMQLSNRRHCRRLLGFEAFDNRIKF